MDYIYAEALCFIARTKVVIPIQLAAYLFENNTVKASDTLEEMRLRLKWLGKISNFKISERYGGGCVDVFFLTQQGADALREIDSSLYKGIGSVGKPIGRRRAIIAHDLYINKALLWLEQFVEIEKYESEKILRKELFIQRMHEANFVRESVKPFTMGDFRIEYWKKHETRIFGKAMCEIALTLNYDQIEKKPDDMWWFVSNEANADLISEAKGKQAKYICNLGKLNCVTFPDTERKKQRELFKKRFADEKSQKDSWGKMMYGLKNLGGAGTAEAVAAIVSCDRTTASRTLSEMENEGFLFTQNIQMISGVKVGARKKLFIVGDNEILDLPTRKYFLNISEWVVQLKNNNYILKKYDSETGGLYFQDKSLKQSKELLVIVDDIKKSTYDVEEIFIQANRAYSNRIVKLSVWAFNRKRDFARLNETDFISIEM